MGLGDIEPRAAPALIFHLKDKQVRHIACGGNFFLGLGSDVEPSINEPSLRTRKSTPERVHDLRYVQAQREVTNRKIDTSFTSGFKYSDEASVKVKRNKENRNSPYVAKHDILNQAAQKRKGGVTRKSLEKRKQSVSRERNGKDVDISFESQRNGSNRHNEVIKLEKINPPVYANGRARREHSMSGIDFELEQHEMPDRPRSTTPFHNHDMNREADISLQRSEFMARDKEREFRDENMRKDEILQDLEFQLELKEREIEKLNHEVSLLTSQFYESKVDLEKLNRNAHSENSRAEDLMRENDDLKADVHRMKQENEQIKLNHNSISRDYQMVDTQYILKVKTLEAQLDHKSGELERMHVYANQLSNNIKILENENKDFNQKLHDETTKAASSESSIEEMSIQILRLRTEIEQVHAKSRESETQNRSLGTETLGLRQSLDDAKIQNRAQNSEIAALRQSLNETNQQLQKALDDLQFSRKTNEEMRLQISHVDGGSKFLREENSRIKRSLDELEVVSKSEAQKYESLIARLKETQESDRQSYEHKLESERQNRLKLENDLHILKNEKSKTENEVHLMIQEKNSVENKLKESQSHLDSESFKLAQYQSRYESDNKRLQLELESLKRDYSELRVVVNNTQHENSQLNSTISNTDIDFKKMRDENWSLKQEISELNRRVQNLAGENEDIRVIYQEFKAQSDETVTLIGQENNLLNQNIDDMKYETEKLQQQINDKLGTIENLYMMNREWEDRFNSVIMENQGLQKEVNDLESKNKHLFETLERELGQRAKEYKERTLTMLNTPNKNTVSPYIARANVVVVPSPRESVKRKSPTHESQDRIGNAAERLLEALNESPIRDSRNTSPMRKGSDFFNERQKILPAKDLSLTPQRSDLNSRISALMQSRAKLKELDNGL